MSYVLTLVGDPPCWRQRERKRERKRERETETERRRQRQTERQRDRETERQRDRETETEPGREGVLLYISYMGMCRPKGNGFGAALVWNKVIDFAVLVWNRLWFWQEVWHRTCSFISLVIFDIDQGHSSSKQIEKENEPRFENRAAHPDAPKRLESSPGRGVTTGGVALKISS